MFSSIANYLTKLKINRQNPARKKQFLSWNKIEKMALVIDAGKALNKSEIDKFIDDTKKYVEVFFIEPASKQASYSDWKCFSKKDTNILNLPKAAILTGLDSKKFDVVIAAAERNQLYGANITSQLNAAFKCGSNNLYGELDMIIDRKDDQDLRSYLKEVMKYLQMIRTE